jgi:3-deoxy-D-manno-oct-2-ulosonic acid (Kdo) hydroxylase
MSYGCRALHLQHFGPTEKQITSLETIPITRWQGPFAEPTAQAALRSLELGKILYFPTLAYVLKESWAILLSPLLADNKAKNISYDAASGALKGTTAAGAQRLGLQTMMAAFSAAATRFVVDLLHPYAGRIECARASYRPVEIAERAYSPRKDDRLLHVDAFPSVPTRGHRILRLFCNINPSGKPRVWHVGEPFPQFAERFLPALGRPAASRSWLLAAIGATRGRRSAYDELMLGLHDNAKRDAVYQRSAPREEIAYPAGSTWLCFTDQVLHAALAGQYALEQTFYLDVAAMLDPASSPVRTLERITRRNLC